MLILFDIDGTLVTSRAEVSDGGSRDGVGTASMIEAGRNLFGPEFSLTGIEIAGRLDRLIWRDAARMFGVADPDAEHERFRAEYIRVMERRLRNGAQVRLLPGVSELVVALARLEHITLGLLTGNYPETGRMKVEAAGLDASMFKVGAWGCDGESRRDLPPLAMRAYCDHMGCEIEAERVIIIGDTPHDIDCARTHRCRSIGVATGAYSVEELIACGADLALADLSETRAVVDWVLDGSTRSFPTRPGAPMWKTTTNPS